MANGAQAIVLGRYLYIDGGELTYKPNGTATVVPGTASRLLFYTR